jgi:dUTP pyrophosphatase
LHFPEATKFYGNTLDSVFVNLQVKGKMVDNYQATGYLMYPRSSISKTPLTLANSVGVVDAGYRGNLIAAFRNLNNHDNSVFEVKQHERLVQICHPSLQPFFVEYIDDEDLLGSTLRGEGGFGSTGK